MNIRPQTIIIDDEHVPAAVVACNAEPLFRPDYRAKKRTKPRNVAAREGERIGAGHFVFKRADHGRVLPRRIPFEHGSVSAARREAERLAKFGGTFEVYERVAVIGDGAEGGDE